MRKKLLSMLLCATMVATMTTGCGDSSGNNNDDTSGSKGSS